MATKRNSTRIAKNDLGISVAYPAAYGAQSIYASDSSYDVAMSRVRDAVIRAQADGYASAGVSKRTLVTDGEDVKRVVSGIVDSLGSSLGGTDAIGSDALIDGIDLADSRGAHLAAAIARAMLTISEE